MKTAHLRAMLLAAAGLAAGCGNFEEPTTIIDLRTLAIRAAAPEIQVDPNQPDARFLTTLTALVLDPAGAGRPVTYEVVACPRDLDAVTAATGRAGAVCKPYDPQSTALDRSVPVTPPGAPPATPQDEGPVHEIVIRDFEYPVELLQRALMLDPFAAIGFPSSIIFQITISAGTETETAIKRVIFSTPPPGHPDQPANSNPLITEVISYQRDDEGRPIDPRPFGGPDDPPLMVPLGQSIWIEPKGAVAESYFTPVLTRGAMPMVVVEEIPRETLRFTFLTTRGKFTPGHTSSEPSPILGPSERIHIESKYTAPTEMPENPVVDFWIMARDERGGTSWTPRTLTLVAPE